MADKDQYERSLIEDHYFAAASQDEIAGVLNEKVEEWINYTISCDVYRKAKKSYNLYYGNSGYGRAQSSFLQTGGDKGQYSLMSENFFRNYLQHILNLTTKERPAFDCRSANTDAESNEQCQLGNSLLEWYMRDKKIERYLKQTVEGGIVTSDSWLVLDWLPSKGRVLDVIDGKPKFEGDLGCKVFLYQDVVRDVNYRDLDNPWHILIEWVNKYDLAAAHPHLAEEIIAFENDNIYKWRENFYERDWRRENEDLIPVFQFRHEISEALPEGRMTRSIGSDILLFDGPLPYRKQNILRLSPSQMLGSNFSYTVAFDLMGPQDALNLLDSTILTNQKTFGVGSIKAPEGHNLRYQKLAEGLNFLVCNEKNGKLEPINFTRTPPEIFQFRQELAYQTMQTLSGINSMVQGNPAHNITSGAYGALLTSLAIEFNSSLQMAYAQLCESTGQAIIELLQDYAETERVAKIVGKNNRYKIESFSSKSIDKISTVVVDITNPLSQTTSGRLQMARDLFEMGQIKRPEQYMQVMTTGRLEPMYQSEVTQLNRINRENEMLMEGRVPKVLSTDNHPLDIREHMSLLDNPDFRENDVVVNAVTQHAFEHFQVWQSTDPAILQAMGIPPAPAGATPDQFGIPSKGPEQMTDPSAVPQGELPNMPNLPNNPMTGETIEGVQPPNLQPPM